VTQPLDRAIQKKELDLEPAPYLIRGSSRIMTNIGTEFAMKKYGLKIIGRVDIDGLFPIM